MAGDGPEKVAANGFDVAADRRLVGGAVHVWRVDLDAVLTGGAATVLSPGERERARRLHHPRDGDAFLASRVALRRILAGYLASEPAAIRFAVAGRGRPSIVDGGDLSFSLSRSAPLALVAVARGRSLGVDVERIRPLADVDILAVRYFPPAEARALRTMPEPERLAAFFAGWVRLEAAVKATGVGLSGAERPEYAEAVGAGLTISQVRAGPGFAAAVAVEGPVAPIRIRDLAELQGLLPPP